MEYAERRRKSAAPLLFGSAEATHETFPTFAAALSTRAVDPTPVGPVRLPVVLAHEYQASSDVKRVATHNHPALPAIPPGQPSRRCIVRFMLRPVCFCPALLAGYDEMQHHLSSALWS